MDFTHTYVILTGNVPVEQVTRFFKPEFLNRLDNVLRFDQLDETALAVIARNAVAHLAQMALDEHRVTLSLTDAAATSIVDANRDEIAVYGARPIRRFVEQRLASDLSHRILSGDLPHSRALTVDFEHGKGLFFAETTQPNSQAEL